VSDGHSLGYDLKSFNVDGSDFIEVKAVRQDGAVTSFFLSENERRSSQELESYYFYLVIDPRGRRRVSELSADRLTAEMLSPLVHQASFSESPPRDVPD
jgi:hypothetical protein